jgi:hypothetical protein
MILPAALAMTVAALGVAACGDDKKSGTAGTKAPAKPTVLSITTSDAAKKRFTTDAPSSIKGGLVEISFKNATKTPQEAQLIRVEGQHTTKEVLDVVATNDTVKIPEWLYGEGGVSTTPPGKTGITTENLPAGHYLVTDSETGDDDNAPAPSLHGAVAEFDVTAAPEGQLPAAPGGTIKVVDDGKDKYRFETSGLKAGSNEVLFDNQSKGELHHVVVVPIKKNATIADVKKAFDQGGPGSGPPPLDFSKFTGTSVIDGERAMVTTLNLTKGRNAFICFINDRDSVKPHFKQGLLKEVTIP